MVLLAAMYNCISCIVIYVGEIMGAVHNYFANFTSLEKKIMKFSMLKLVVYYINKVNQDIYKFKWIKNKQNLESTPFLWLCKHETIY